MKELISLKCREGKHDRCWLDWSESWREGAVFPEPLPWTTPGANVQEEVAS